MSQRLRMTSLSWHAATRRMAVAPLTVAMIPAAVMPPPGS